ncbi:hypothetical protein [Clostridium cavendishii]|nr:hypothetical protein [Clostridium cavendishii]
MKPLDNFNEIVISEENAKKYLNDIEFKEFKLMSNEEKNQKLRNLLEKPIFEFTVINELYFRSKWAECVNILMGDNRLNLLEIASGDADMIPQMMARNNINSHYITANMNKELNSSLTNKTKDLPIRITLIDDDAANIKKYLGEEQVDIIAFQHSVNDIVQAILCEDEGIDTVYSNWIEILPKMIEIMKREDKNNSLEESVKLPFLNLIKSLLGVLKKDGFIIINHYMFQFDLELGYPEDIWENFVLITRKWLSELEECEEFAIDGFNEQWWIFLKKN